MKIEARIKELGIELPGMSAPKPCMYLLYRQATFVLYPASCR